jgi:hypothetical protein
MKWMFLCCTVLIVGCAGAPSMSYDSAQPEVASADAADPSEARALEQAEADCARQGKHAVSQRVEGETLYDCAD